MHSIFSDGVLVPAELARRSEVIGCRYIAITDHVDLSNVGHVVESIVRFAEEDDHTVKVIPGVEVTHVTPGQIADVVKAARAGGARIVLVHGETIVEPVQPGTNEAAVDAGVDIIAHPGLITPGLAKKAASAGVALELSGRRGHELANGHVARAAMDAGAALVFSTDAHAPGDFMDRRLALKAVQGAGLSGDQAESVLAHSQTLVEAFIGAV
jgi:histidinol phosphatase-like PHP family hydrolase